MGRWRLCMVFVVVGSTAALVAGSAAQAGTGGWRTHRVPQAGFELDAPDTWVDMTRDTPAVVALIQKHPALFFYARKFHTDSSGIRLILVELSPAVFKKTGLFANATVVEGPAAGDLKSLAGAIGRQLKATGQVRGQVSTTTINLPAGRAVEVRYATESPTNPGKVLAATEYLLIRKNVVYALGYLAPAGLASQYAGIFLRSARSFRFL